MILRLTLALACAAQQPPTDMQVLLETVLDQPAQLSLKDVKLPALIEALERETGVAVRMSPETMALLPHGPETVFTQAEFGHVSLRQGLTGLFAGLGMEILVRRDHVEVAPKPPLLRIGRRATWSELDTLAQVSALQPGVNEADLNALLPRLQFNVPQARARDMLAARIHDVGAGPGDRVLDVACEKLGWSWHPLEAHIVVLPLQAQYEQQLQRMVTVRRQSRPFTAVLDEIARQCGLPIRVEPGALSALSPGARQNFLFGVEGYSGGDTLGAIASQARLTYVITEEGVIFYDPASNRPAWTGPVAPLQEGPREDAIIGLVPVTLSTGQEIQLLIRESDLPADVLEDLRQRKEEVMQKIREALHKP